MYHAGTAVMCRFKGTDEYSVYYFWWDLHCIHVDLTLQKVPVVCGLP